MASASIMGMMLRQRLRHVASIVEIDTTELHMELYSEKIKTSDHHIAKFDLVDPTARRSFFTLFSKDGKPIEFPDVIVPTR